MDTIYTPHFWNFRPPSFRIFWFRSILKYEEHPSWRSLKRAKIGLLDKIRPLFWRFSTSPQDFQNLRRMKDADFQKIGRMIEKKLKHHFRFFPAMICICSRARSSCFLCDLHGSLSNVVSQVFIEFFSEVSFKIWSYFFSKFPNFLWNFWEFSYFFSKFRKCLNILPFKMGFSVVICSKFWEFSYFSQNFEYFTL